MLLESRTRQDKVFGFKGVTTSTRLEGITTNAKGKSPCELFFGKLPKFVKHLRTFGEIGVTARLDRKFNGKLDDKGNVCMMVGYAENHAGDVYCMLNLRTKQICVSRDVYWLGKTYGTYMKLKDVPEVEETDEEEDDNENNKKQKEVRFEIPSTSRTVNNLEIETDEGFGSVEERVEAGRVLRSGREIGNIAVPVSWEDFAMCNMALMASSVEEVKYEPKTFQEAWWLEDLEEREK